MTRLGRQERSASPSRAPIEPPRLFRACEACAKAKSKCDDVTDKGCSRCRARRLGCSLMEALIASKEPSSILASSASGAVSRYPEDAPWSQSSLGPSPSQHANWDGRQLQRHESNILALEDRIRYLEDRVVLLEGGVQQQLAQLQAATSRSSVSVASHAATQVVDTTYALQPMTSTSQFTTPIQPTVTHESLSDDHVQIVRRRFDPQVYTKCLQKPLSTLVFDESILSVLGQEEYPNLIERGVISQSQLDMAFHTFKHVFYEMFPLPSFLDVSTPTPTHAFVVIALLSHVPDIIPETCNLDLIVEESIMFCMAGTASYQAMLALFILSHSPWTKLNLSHVPFSTFRVVSLAYSIGVDLGLDKKAERTLRYPEYATDEQLEHALVWLAVYNRYVLECFTRIGKPMPDMSHLLPPNPSPRFKPTVDYLRLQSQLLCLPSEITPWLENAELDSPLRWVDVDGLSKVWSEFMVKAEAMKKGEWAHEGPSDSTTLEAHTHLPAPHAFLFDLDTLLYCLGIRVSVLIISPYPVLSIDTLVSAHSTGYIIMKDTAAPIISSFLHLRKAHPTLAASRMVVSMAMAAMSTARRAVVILTSVNPVAAKFIDMALLEEGEDVIRSLPILPGELFRVAWDQLEEGFSQPEKTSTEPDFDLASIGLEGFDWLLQPLF